MEFPASNLTKQQGLISRIIGVKTIMTRLKYLTAKGIKSLGVYVCVLHIHVMNNDYNLVAENQ